MNRLEIKAGEKVIMAVPQCTPKKCICKKNLKKIIRSAVEGERMEAAFYYAREKSCPQDIYLDTKLMAKAVKVGKPESIPVILLRVVVSLSVLAGSLSALYLLAKEVLKWT